MDFNVKQAIIDRLTATKRVNRIALYNYMLKNGFYTRRCHSSKGAGRYLRR